MIERVAAGASSYDACVDVEAFRAALAAVPATERDAWFDRLLGLRDLPDDEPSLPRGSVPYLPCPIDLVREAMVRASVLGSDVVLDVGSGVGRAAIGAHLLTGARVSGLELQPALVESAREIAARLSLPRVSFVAGDAARDTWVGEARALLEQANVFFLYCPFGQAGVQGFLRALEPIATTRAVRVACVDMAALDCAWLEPTHVGPSLRVLRSTFTVP